VPVQLLSHSLEQLLSQVPEHPEPQELAQSVHFVPTVVLFEPELEQLLEQPLAHVP
jgi:hypothetical protein